MKIVFITSSYYPYFSAIGKCVYNLVNELKQENEVIVISNMTSNNLKNEVEFDGHKIIRVRTESMIKRDKILSNNESKNKFVILNNRIKMQLLRMAGYLNTIVSKETIQKSLVKEYFKELLSLGDIDLIVPTCYPFESIIAAQEYKNITARTIQIIPFLFDKFSDSPTLHRNKINKKIKYKNNLSLEEEMIKGSARVLYVDSWIDKMKKYFSAYDDKLIHVEHPLIVNHFSGISFDNININSEYIDISYTGVIDKKVRPPYETLKIISRMIEINDKLRFHFYVLGNCTDEINYYHIKYPNNIFNHGQVESNIALLKIMQSSILLSIGNTDNTLIPSKIFEYMSSGKPIIHFFHSENDRVISMLKDYGIGYCINQNKEITDLEINKLVDFCKYNKNNNKHFEEVQNLFYKANPRFISRIILNGQENQTGNNQSFYESR
jgi:glycosyltransferase involved in cell wall biosynthesis